MPSRNLPRGQLPIALTIAGSDSGGGAGIQADLKTFAALGIHGVCAITSITAQNPARVLAVEPVTPTLLEKQLTAVFSELSPAAIKTGMVYSGDLVRVTAEFLRKHRRIPIVIDPVMIATSGAPLIEKTTAKAMREQLFPLATLITPNLGEAEALLNIAIKTPEDLRCAAWELHKRFNCAVLAKGGHLKTSRDAIDFFYDGRNELMLSAPRIKGIHTHGTGCTYSAAITAGLAKGEPLTKAVIEAKTYISTAIGNSRRVGRHFVLGIPARLSFAKSRRDANK
jgi:hydroxymethylpyrimidine kinase/phosphomethylpyrimidine kinase